ncbi:unnamed protein product [Rhizophagus irregularis]|nr:unnamed protein product [Rhizophagus irregularis]
MILGHWLDWYQINVKKWVFLEAGEAKTTIDSHHAQITHAIKRQVRLGLDIMEGVDIETAIREIQGTSVAHLEPNRTRDQNKKAKNTLPVNGLFLCQIHQTTATRSIDPKRLTKEQLSLELTKRKINVVKTAKRDELIRELELAITNNIEIIQDTSDASEEKGASEEKENTNIICNSFQDFPLESGWALKSKQKYGKRGSGKRLSKRKV